MKKLRLFFNSNAIWGISGYSNQIAELLPLLKDEGYPIAICNFFGQQGGIFDLDGIKQYPVINHVYGSDAIVLHANDFKADITFTLQDQWVLNPDDLQRVKNWIPITPIDSEPVSPVVLEKLKYATKIITYSKYGQKELQKNGFFSTYIPHTVNTDIFKPMDKKERKAKSGLPTDCFLIGMVAANKDNPPRKSFQEVLDAFKLFLEIEPKALLYIHTNPQFPGGFPIDKYAEFLKIKDKVLFPDNYQMNFNVKKEQMALIYNTFDCFVMPSRSEGFGLGFIEAQSCGVPVIGQRWTSMTELIKENETGFLCEPIHKWWTPQGAYWAVPSTQSLYECFVKIHKADRVKMGESARNFMLENYDTKKIFTEKWKPYIEKLEIECYGKQPVAQENKKDI